MGRQSLLAVLLLIVIVPQAWGFTSQYSNPNRQTIWNNITDGIHTFGQTPQQAKLTKMKLHAARAKARLNSINRAVKAKRQARFKAWQASQNNSP